MDTSGFGWTTGSNITWSTGTTTVYPAVVSTGPLVLAPSPTAAKRTPLEWLEDEVERICALTREGLVAA